jgi:hypothetical protein
LTGAAASIPDWNAFEADPSELPGNPWLRAQVPVDDVESQQRPQREERRPGRPSLRGEGVGIGQRDVRLVTRKAGEHLWQSVLEGDRRIDHRRADSAGLLT